MFYFLTGSTSSYTNWAPGQPGVVGSAENCAAMDSKNGKWIDYFCRSVLFFPNTNKFICEYRTRADYFNWAHGQPGFGAALENCAAMDPTTGKWHDYYCEDLLFINNDNAFICEYRTDASYTNWAKGQPGTVGGFEDCVAMYSGDAEVMTTTDVPTTTTEVPTTTTEVPTTTELPTTASEAPTTTELPTTASEAPTTTELPTTASEAPTTAEVPTTTVNEATPCPPFECSLDCGLDGYAIADMGCTDASYTNWSKDQPGAFGGFEDCVAMYSGDGMWHDYPCHDVLFVHKDRKFICQYPISADGNTTTTEAPPTPTTSTTAEFTTTTTESQATRSEASYTNWAPDQPSDASSTENCAAINSGDGLWHDYFCENALFFHNDNKFICEYRITTTTTDVVTPTEVPTTDFLTTGVPATSELPPTTTIVAGDTPCPLFQCALDCGLNGYDVTDMGYSRAFYTNWASDQPGFAGALEDCVTMDASDGKWHDHYCEDVLFVQNDEAFICQYRE
ncbi:hypothetical protein BaRGS_00026253 [Batillaria attramentaria]|uniref:C-type lectin domain-containing protein n=1 Tax=Batillaria attramentaria TaxID=370345 RepID=A0ABD0K505_9CAEN